MPRTTNARSFADFTARLAAQWRLGTTPTKPPVTPIAGDPYTNMQTLLGRLVSFPTVTGNAEAITDALDYVQDYLRTRGMYTKRLEHNGVESLVATTRRTKKPRVLLAGHIDVVAGPEQLFVLRKSKERLHGRGVLDMKCAIATFMQIVDTLATAGTLARYDLGIAVSSDEEAGGTDGVAYLVEQGYRPTVCVLPDGGDDWQIQLFSKGIELLSVSVNGKAAHGSRPWAGINAIDTLMAVIDDIRQLFPELTPESNTINIGKISGGKAVNQVADQAEALLDMRVISEADRATLLKQMEDICDRHGAILNRIATGVTTSFSLEEPYIASFADTITAVTGIPITGSATMGSNDARFFAAHNIPCISFYPIGGGHHGPEEWLDQKAFNQSYDIIMRYVQQHARLT